MSQKTKDSILDNVKLALQFWHILVAIIGGAFYIGQQAATLTTRVSALETQVTRIELKVDAIGREKPTQQINYRKREVAN